MSMNFNSEQEKYYYDLLVDMLDDGIIDESERNILNKRKEKYAISDTRAKELEDFAINERLENKKSKVAKLRNKNILKKEDEIKEYEDNEAEKEDYEILKYKKRKNKKRDISFFDRITYYAKNKRHPLLKIYTYVVVFALEVYLIRNCIKYIKNTKIDSLFGDFFNWVFTGAKKLIIKALGLENLAQGVELTLQYVLIIVILLAFFIIFNLLLIYLPAFISLMGNRSKKQIKRDINLSTIFFSLILIIFSFFFVKDNNEEVNLMRKNVNAYIKSGNYQKAYEEIIAKKDSIDTNVLSVEYQKLLDAITNKLNNMNTIDASIKSVYNQAVGQVKEHETTYNQAIDSISKRNFNNYITGFIAQKRYLDAYNTIDKINNNLELQKRFFLFIDTKEDEIKKIKKEAFDSLTSTIYNDFGVRINSDMNKDNYDFINSQIISVYDKIPDENKKQYDENVKKYKNTLDIKRDDYLKKLMGEISNISNPSDAKIRLNNEVYHNSTANKKDVENQFLIFKTNPKYKDYWEDVKKEYLKKLNKK